MTMPSEYETAAQHEMKHRLVCTSRAAKQLQVQEAERMRAKELQEQGEAQLESKEYSSAAATSSSLCNRSR